MSDLLNWLDQINGLQAIILLLVVIVTTSFIGRWIDASQYGKVRHTLEEQDDEDQ